MKKIFVEILRKIQVREENFMPREVIREVNLRIVQEVPQHFHEILEVEEKPNDKKEEIDLDKLFG